MAEESGGIDFCGCSAKGKDENIKISMQSNGLLFKTFDSWTIMFRRPLAVGTNDKTQ